MRRTILLATAIVATLGALATSALASRLFLRGGERGFSVTFASFEYLMWIGGAPAGASCPVTMEGSFHATTIVKSGRSLIGSITSVAIDDEACTTARGTLPSTLDFLEETLPWHVRYRSFSGTLPAITQIGLEIVDMSMEIDEFPEPGEILHCLYRAMEPEPAWAGLLVQRNVLVGMRMDENIVIPFESGSLLLCDPDLEVSGTGAMTQQGETATISVNLI